MGSNPIIVTAWTMVVIAFALVAYTIWILERIFVRFQDDRQLLIKQVEERVGGQRDEIHALTEALGKIAGVQVVYPRRTPLEPSEGWLDGKPKVTKITVG